MKEKKPMELRLLPDCDGAMLMCVNAYDEREFLKNLGLQYDGEGAWVLPQKLDHRRWKLSEPDFIQYKRKVAVVAQQIVPHFPNVVITGLGRKEADRDLPLRYYFNRYASSVVAADAADKRTGWNRVGDTKEMAKIVNAATLKFNKLLKEKKEWKW